MGILQTHGVNGRAVPGARGRAGRSDPQRSVAGPLEFNILKTHPVPRQRILALVKAFFGAKEKRGLQPRSRDSKLLKVCALPRGKQRGPQFGLYAPNPLDVDPD